MSPLFLQLWFKYYHYCYAYGVCEGFSCMCILLFGNSNVSYWLLPSYPHSLVIFLLVEAVKELRTEKEKDRDTFKLVAGPVYVNVSISWKGSILFVVIDWQRTGRMTEASG